MKARILDEEALEAVTPAALRAYAVGEGWHRVETYGETSEIYARRVNGDVQELLIPFTSEIADYASAVERLITFISRFENRDQLTIYRDLTRADTDVIRVRALEAYDDGSIDIDSGVGIFQHARDMLASAACSAIDPRRSYHLGKVQRAEDYMRRVRLGQTEVGSFVVALLAPIPPALSTPHQEPLWPELENEPYERQVTRVLCDGIRAARDAIVASNRGDGINAFYGAVQMGVSANLCEAIASIVDRADGADISITWAQTRPAPIRRATVSFKRSDSEILKEAARQFRLREPRRDERVFGYVTHLRRPEDQPEGYVRIKAIVDGKLRSISTELSEVDYQQAIVAHKRQVLISLVGDLETRGHRWRIVEPQEVVLIEDEGDEE
jgi:hypothetical protein